MCAPSRALLNPGTNFQSAGISAGDIKKLKESGYNTVEGTAYATKKALCDIKGISEAKAEKIIEAAGKLDIPFMCALLSLTPDSPHTGKFVSMGFATATEVFQTHGDRIYLSTGSSELDKLLQGQMRSLPPACQSRLMYSYTLILHRWYRNWFYH